MGGRVCVTTYLWRSKNSCGNWLSPLIKWISSEFSRLGGRPLNHLTSYVLNVFQASIFWKYSVYLYVTEFSISWFTQKLLGGLLWHLLLITSPSQISWVSLFCPLLSYNFHSRRYYNISSVYLPLDSAIYGIFAYPASYCFLNIIYISLINIKIYP